MNKTEQSYEELLATEVAKAEQDAASMTLTAAWNLIKKEFASYKSFYDGEMARQVYEPHDVFDKHAIKLLDEFIAKNNEILRWVRQKHQGMAYQEQP